MTTHSTGRRGLAIASGALFTAGGILIIMGDVVTKPSAWTIYHALTILTIAGTIAAGHLSSDAARGRHILAAIGFTALFLAGTALVVYQSVGRQAETTDAKTLSIQARNAEIEAKAAELTTSRQRLADAERMVSIETGTSCGRKCLDWKRRAAEVRGYISTLESDLARLGAPAPVAPKADKMAAVAALFGADHAKARAALMLAEPFLWTLFFEIGSVVSLGFAFGGKRRATVADRMQTSFAGSAPVAMFAGEFPDPPTPPKPKRRKPLPKNIVPFPARVSHPVVAALETVSGPVNNSELATLMGVSAGESSKRCREVAHLLEVRRQGREVLIALRQTSVA